MTAEAKGKHKGRCRIIRHRPLCFAMARGWVKGRHRHSSGIRDGLPGLDSYPFGMARNLRNRTSCGLHEWEYA